jgi:hypothetical protein
VTVGTGSEFIPEAVVLVGVGNPVVVADAVADADADAD